MARTCADIAEPTADEVVTKLEIAALAEAEGDAVLVVVVRKVLLSCRYTY